MKTPDIFKTNAYKTLKTTVLSTSNCGNPSLRMFGLDLSKNGDLELHH